MSRALPVPRIVSVPVFSNEVQGILGVFSGLSGETFLVLEEYAGFLER